jgi:2-haloacid dehalogenase
VTTFLYPSNIEHFVQDWESGIYESILPIIQHSQEPWTRTEALAAFHSVEADLQAQNPTDLYTKVLADSYYNLAKRLGLPEDGQLTEDSLAFGNSVGKWPIFPDTVEALAQLSKHYRLIVLSNVDRSSFSHTQKILEHGFQFDLILTAQVGYCRSSIVPHPHVQFAGHWIIQTRPSKFRVYAE